MIPNGFFIAVFAFRQVRHVLPGRLQNDPACIPGSDAPPFDVKPHDCWPEKVRGPLGGFLFGMRREQRRERNRMYQMRE